jgi:hypothetical protein
VNCAFFDGPLGNCLEASFVDELLNVIRSK